jgi:hypothetical protein
MISRRKLFGLLAGLPFVRALPPVPIWAGVDLAQSLDRTSYVTLTWDPVPNAIGYRIARRIAEREDAAFGVTPIFYE